MTDTTPFVCPNCGSIIAPDDEFCSHCGIKLTQKNQKIGIGKQIWIYFVALALPPFGLVWTWKYLRTDNPQMKRIGWIALILTVVAIILTVWTIQGFLQGVQNQMNSYSNLGL